MWGEIEELPDWARIISVESPSHLPQRGFSNEWMAGWMTREKQLESHGTIKSGRGACQVCGALRFVS